MLFGTERHILSIAKNSDRTRFVHEISVPRLGTLTEELDKIGIKYHINGRMSNKKSKFAGLFENKAIFRLWKLIRTHKYDIIHTHLNSYGGFLAKAAGAANVIHTRHGIFWTEEELKKIPLKTRKLQALKAKYFTRTIALSKIEKDVMVKYFGYDENIIEIIYNGVTISELNSGISGRYSKKDLYDTDSFIVGSIGRFERQKGYDKMVECAKKVIEKIKNIKFVVIGRGSLKNSLLQQIERLGLTENFILLDYQKEVFEYLNHFDVFVSTSLWEGVPYVILEAMGLGKPTIAFTSNLSGVNEMIDSGKNGYLIRDNFVEQLSELIIELYNDKTKRDSISRESIKHVETKFSEIKMVQETENLYNKIVGEK